MLRHHIDSHEGEEIKNVRWGMFIIKYMRTIFERQIEEAVTIQRKSEGGEILNSMAEYNQDGN